MDTGLKKNGLHSLANQWLNQCTRTSTFYLILACVNYTYLWLMCVIYYGAQYIDDAAIQVEAASAEDLLFNISTLCACISIIVMPTIY